MLSPMRTWHGVSAHWSLTGYPASFYTWPVQLLSAQSVSSQASTAQRGWSAEERAERMKSVCGGGGGGVNLQTDETVAHCSTPTHLGGTQMIKHDNAVRD